MTIVMCHHLTQMRPAAEHVLTMIAMRVELPVTHAVGTGDPDIRAAVDVQHVTVDDSRDIHIVARGHVRLAYDRLRNYDGRARTRRRRDDDGRGCRLRRRLDNHLRASWGGDASGQRDGKRDCSNSAG
jgi:hypothetical protein